MLHGKIWWGCRGAGRRGGGALSQCLLLIILLPKYVVIAVDTYLLNTETCLLSAPTCVDELVHVLNFGRYISVKYGNMSTVYSDVCG